MRIANLAVRILPAAIFASCSVVPDPTENGVSVDPAATSIMGTWKATYFRSTESFIDRITLFQSHRYQRWIVDSTPATATAKDVLVERGAWNYHPSDSSRIALVPSLRQKWTGTSLEAISAPPVDSVSWRLSNDTLRWILPRWSGRDTLDTLGYIQD